MSPYLTLEERFLLLRRVNQMESALVLLVEIGVGAVALAKLRRISARKVKEIGFKSNEVSRAEFRRD